MSTWEKTKRNNITYVGYSAVDYGDIKIYNESDNDFPGYQTPGAAAFDIASNETLCLEEGQTSLMRTGLYFVLPECFMAEITPRSSLGLRGITIPNSPGVIDSDYRGEVKVLLTNLSNKAHIIVKGDRIAQVMIRPVIKPLLVSLSYSDFQDYNNTERGSGGFGSTGKN